MSARRVPLFALGTSLLLLLLASAAVALALWQPEDLRWRDPGVQRWIQAGSAVLGYLLLIVAGRWRRRGRVARAQGDDDCDDAVLVADQPLQPVFLRRRAHVLQNRRAVGNRAIAGPGPECVAQGVHV